VGQHGEFSTKLNALTGTFGAANAPTFNATQQFSAFQINNVTVFWHDMSTGKRNLGLGANALELINSGTGTDNVAAGTRNLEDATNAIRNTAMGGQSQRFSIGNNNSSLGFGSVYNASGNNVTGLGALAGFQYYEGDNAIIIGSNNYASSFSGTSDILVIDIMNTAEPLIEGDFDGNILTTNGEFHIDKTSSSATDGQIYIDGDREYSIVGRNYVWTFLVDAAQSFRCSTAAAYFPDSIVYNNDADTTFDRTSADTIEIDTGGALALKLNSSQNVYAPNGIMIGAEADNNKIDDASNGTGSTALYVGNQSIDTTAFTLTHKYRIGEVMQPGMAVVLAGNQRIYACTTANDPRCIGILIGKSDWRDSFGNEFITYGTKAVQVETTEMKWQRVPARDAIELSDRVVYVTEEVQVEIPDAINGDSDTVNKRIIERYKEVFNVINGELVNSTEPVYATRTIKVPTVKDGYRFNKNNGKFYTQVPVYKTVVEEDYLNPIVIETGEPARPIDYTRTVACSGDSVKDNLKGAWVTVDNGPIQMGDYLVSSPRKGYLMKQSDNIKRNYTVGKAMQDLTEDTQEAYIYISN
jgi:hypothetical protein